jgi:hypothetical protein
MGLDYKNISKGQYVNSELTESAVENSNVRSDIGDQWYLHVIADLVNEKKVSEQEFANIFQAHVEPFDE